MSARASKKKNTAGKSSVNSKSKQTTLFFSKGKMGIESSSSKLSTNNSQVAKDDKPIDSSSDKGKNSARKRKPKDLEEGEKSSKKTPKTSQESPDEETKETTDEVIKMELDLKYSDIAKMKDLTSTSFDPIKDAPYKRHQHIPLSLVAHSCQKIEE